MSANAIRGILVDLDETPHSREDAFWAWIASEAQTAGAAEQLDRERIAALDQRGRGNKPVLLGYLAAVFGWHEEEEARLNRFRLGIAAACCLQRIGALIH